MSGHHPWPPPRKEPMSTTLPTREELADIVGGQYRWEVAGVILARLRPAWEQMEKLVSEKMDVSYLKDQDRLRLQSERDAAHADVRALATSLREALNHAIEHMDGCLHCGEGEIVDGTTKPEHHAQCWWYQAKALLARPGVRAVIKGSQRDQTEADFV